MLVEVLGKDLYGSCPFFLLRMFKQCLVKEADSGRRAGKKCLCSGKEAVLAMSYCPKIKAAQSWLHKH